MGYYVKLLQISLARGRDFTFNCETERYIFSLHLYYWFSERESLSSSFLIFPMASNIVLGTQDRGSVCNEWRMQDPHREVVMDAKALCWSVRTKGENIHAKSQD